jgi:anti-anti-sigma regulatory factor
MVAAGGSQVIIDLEAPEFIDCHAVGALLGVREQARRAGGTYCWPPRAVRPAGRSG